MQFLCSSNNVVMVYPEKCITLILNMEIIPKKHTQKTMNTYNNKKVKRSESACPLTVWCCPTAHSKGSLFPGRQEKDKMFGKL